MTHDGWKHPFGEHRGLYLTEDDWSTLLSNVTNIVIKAEWNSNREVVNIYP